MKETVLLLVIVFAILLIITGPIATIWSLNTLFNLNIDTNLYTWLATAWLQLVTVGNIVTAVKKK